MIKMPLLFVGHGSPLNAIEDNSFTRNWRKIAALIPKPAAILAISAHWYTDGSKITDAAYPKTVYDMYGFPPELYRVTYPAPGAPQLAHHIMELIPAIVTVEFGWGLDHGAWSVLHVMYPEADIPVLQLSVDAGKDMAALYEIGKQLEPLRHEGVLIFGSGNVVHNLSRVDFSKEDGYCWAEEFDASVKDKIKRRAYREVIDYGQAGPSTALAFPTPDHFDPLIYVLGAADPADQVTVWNDSCIYGSLSMTCYLFQDGGIPDAVKENSADS